MQVDSLHHAQQSESNCEEVKNSLFVHYCKDCNFSTLKLAIFKRHY